jgi:SAM-dependent methyltransferase
MRRSRAAFMQPNIIDVYMPDASEILEIVANSTYDFRRSANPEDPLKDRFSDWVPYYRLKWAVARALKPQRILEVGVHFGYSAAAFLDACPGAEYMGIDDDSGAFGGQEGAIRWARRITAGQKTEFLIADSQQLEAFPGGLYDLIHIDGQQAGAGLVRDLRKALRQAKHILVDGYFGGRENFLDVSEFLYCNRDVIESCVILPGDTGELLFTPRPAADTPSHVTDSGEIRSSYTTAYYLQDCGGYDAYKRDKGLSLADSRLRAVADLTEAAPVGRAIDLCCGRGELSIHLARLGHDVTAVDYSESAIELAREAAANAASSTQAPRIHFRCSDVKRLELSGSYEAVVASDLIEHLMPAELDCLYSRIAAHLAPRGLFIVHTFPNAWHYKYEYARRLRQARGLGAYLPLDPRSRYEQLMHINEQSPGVLRRQLGTYFPHVLLWFAGHDMECPFENLSRPFSIAEMRAAGDLFAIASHTPLSPRAVHDAVTMQPITAPIEARLELLEMPSMARRGSRFSAKVRLTNHSRGQMASRLPNPVHLSYHCYSEARDAITFDGLRTKLPTVRAGVAEEVEMQLAAPLLAGRFRFRITAVQEGVMWFDSPPHNIFVEAWLEVV